MTKEHDMIEYDKYHEITKNKMVWKFRGGKYCVKDGGGRFHDWSVTGNGFQGGGVFQEVKRHKGKEFRSWGQHTYTSMQEKEACPGNLGLFSLVECCILVGEDKIRK